MSSSKKTQKPSLDKKKTSNVIKSKEEASKPTIKTTEKIKHIDLSKPKETFKELSKESSKENKNEDDKKNKKPKKEKILTEPYFIEPSDLPRDRKSPGIVAYNDTLYSLLYIDLRSLTPGERAVHYLEKGIYEGRIATYRQLFTKLGPELYYHFDHKQYLIAYEDLQSQYDIKDRYALLLHYVNNGMAEMRKDCRVKDKLVPAINYWDSDDSDDESSDSDSESLSTEENPNTITMKPLSLSFEQTNMQKIRERYKKAAEERQLRHKKLTSATMQLTIPSPDTQEDFQHVNDTNSIPTISIVDTIKSVDESSATPAPIAELDSKPTVDQITIVPETTTTTFEVETRVDAEVDVVEEVTTVETVLDTDELSVNKTYDVQEVQPCKEE